MTKNQTKHRNKHRHAYKYRQQTKRKKINRYNKSTRKRLSKINRKHKKQTRKNGGSNIKSILPNINADKINKYLEEHNCIEEENKKECQKAKSHGIKSIMKINYKSNISNDWVARYLFKKIKPFIIQIPDKKIKKTISEFIVNDFVNYTKNLKTDDNKQYAGATLSYKAQILNERAKTFKKHKIKIANIKNIDYNKKYVFKALVKHYFSKNNKKLKKEISKKAEQSNTADDDDSPLYVDTPSPPYVDTDSDDSDSDDADSDDAESDNIYKTVNKKPIESDKLFAELNKLADAQTSSKQKADDWTVGKRESLREMQQQMNKMPTQQEIKANVGKNLMKKMRAELDAHNSN